MTFIIFVGGAAKQPVIRNRTRILGIEALFDILQSRSGFSGSSKVALLRPSQKPYIPAKFR